jgi:hypothetical protein
LNGSKANPAHLMWLNPKVLEMAGFEPIADLQSLAARFYGLEVFKIHGFTVDNDCVISSKDLNVRGVCCDLAIGNSLNAGCRELFDDDFIENEGEWLQQRMAVPPFLMVRIGPTRLVIPQGGHMRRISDKEIATYEAFTEAKATVSNWTHRRVSPQLITALTAQFAKLPEVIQFESIYYGAVGVTERGETLNDFTLKAHVELQVSHHRTRTEINEILKVALNGANSITQRSADYFLLATKETDELKAFLFYFLSIEVHVYKTYKRLDRAAHLTTLLSLPERVPAATQSLFSCARDRDDLRDQFVWCVLCAWVELRDDDVETFCQLKELRNDIAHGRVDSVTRDQVRFARQLAAKVLRQR